MFAQLQYVWPNFRWHCCYQMAYFKAKMHQIRFRGSLQHSPDHLARFKGLLLRGGEGKEGERREREKGSVSESFYRNISPWPMLHSFFVCLRGYETIFLCTWQWCPLEYFNLYLVIGTSCVISNYCLVLLVMLSSASVAIGHAFTIQLMGLSVFLARWGRGSEVNGKV